ncbi:MAG: hypothetical protein LBH82_01175 [Bacteroidales bacterium]|jgi:hypothetical protein|nr:hypothetical protein [Bacteroidales bacterium]
MKKQGKSNRSLKNKIIITIILLILIGLMIFAGIKTYKSPIQRKLMGSWNVEIENSYWVRDSIYELIWTSISIEKNKCRFPAICDTNATLEERWTKATGTWKVINTNPDSVFFNVPQNPLHGKYAIRFFIDEKGYSGMNNIYKIELKNDSTYLICNKGGVFYNRDVRDWIDNR